MMSLDTGCTVEEIIALRNQKLEGLSTDELRERLYRIQSEMALIKATEAKDGENVVSSWINEPNIHDHTSQKAITQILASRNAL